MPKVSIIIPTYNAEKFIDSTIQSVIDQTYKDWELIIVDDCSKDNTRMILEEWQKKDTRIQLIFLDKNSGGPAHPKNVGILKATGKYIAYLDHDDEWMPEKLEKQVAVLENDPEIGLISCETTLMSPDGKLLEKRSIEKVPDHGVFPEILSHDFIFSNSSMMLPKIVIDKLGNRDENPKIGLAEDREFELRVAAAGYKFHVIHEPLFRYRSHENMIAVSDVKNGLNYMEVALKYLPYYKKYNLEYTIYERFAKEYLRLGDIDNAKKYCKLTLKYKKEPELIFAYFLLLFGKVGLTVFKSKKILALRNNLLYFLGRKTKFEKDQYSAMLKIIDFTK